MTTEIGYLLIAILIIIMIIVGYYFFNLSRHAQKRQLLQKVENIARSQIAAHKWVAVTSEAFAVELQQKKPDNIHQWRVTTYHCKEQPFLNGKAFDLTITNLEQGTAFIQILQQ